jgi:orotate phosphoribosyltransferase
VPEATFGYAGAVADRMAVPLIQRRVKSKGHGIQQNILGRFGAGTEVVLVDDVIKSSLSKTEEAARLHELSEGQITTTGIVVLVDRLQGGRTELERHNLDFAAALTLDGLAQYALDERLGDMTPTLYDDLMAELDPVELAAVRQV